MCSVFSVQKALLAQHSEELKDWQSLAESAISNVCVFLPSNLDNEMLSNPFYGQLMDVKAMAAYPLCKDTSKCVIVLVLLLIKD